MEILQKFNILDYYLMGVVVAIFLIFILDRYFIDMVKIDIKEEIPDAEVGKNKKELKLYSNSYYSISFSNYYF